MISNPLGQLLDFANPEGLWQHYYYALEVFIHQQLLRSPLRVHTVERADIVFLPIYLGVAQKLFIQYQHKETILLLEEFWDVYRKSSTFQGNKPHWIALADVELLYQAGCGGWGINLLCPKEKQLPAALVVSSPEIFLGVNPKQPLDFTRVFKGSAPSATAVAAPYLGHVHLSRGSLRLQQPFNASVSLSLALKHPLGIYLHRSLCLDCIIPQQKTAHQQTNAPCLREMHCHASFIPTLSFVLAATACWNGLTVAVASVQEVTSAKQYLAMQSFNDKTALRQQLKKECLASNSWQSDCQHIGPGLDSRTGFAYDGIQQAAKESWFCMQPSGDTPTRAATFDCLMAGAIPVFFDPLIYELLPYGDKIPWRDIVVIQLESNRDVTTLEMLTKMPLDARLKRLRLLHDAQTILQYSINPNHRQIQFSTRDEQSLEDDAFTSMLKAVLQHICRRHLLKGRCKS